MKFDDILVHLGEFGFYQKRLYFFVCIPAISEAIHALITVFTVALPDHRCAIPGLDNDTYAVQGFHHQWLINGTIPPGEDSEHSRCQIYDVLKDVVKGMGTSSPNDQSYVNCDRWVFDKSIFQTTITEQMNLVCDDLIKRSHLNMIFQGGLLIGSLVLVTLGDIFGRKRILCLSLMGEVAVAVAVVWVPEYISLSFARGFIGVFGNGYYINAFTLGIELVGPSKRMWTGMGISIFWVIGEFILVALAYFIRDWQQLQLTIALPAVLYISLWWLIPESPRWLLANGCTSKAEKILRRAAEVNKTNLPEEAFHSGIEEDNSHLPRIKLWQMFSHRTLLIRSAVIFINWCVVSMVYYGLSLSSGYLYGGLHMNVFLSVIVELIGYLLCYPLLDRVGRKAIYVCSMLVGGTACCFTILTVLYLPEEYQAITTALALVGKLGASAAFAILYLYSTELFPTVTRNGGMGVSSVSARVGSVASPYISDLGKLIPGSFGIAFPLMVFGGSSILAGLASLTLPETMNRKLPETIGDALIFGKTDNLDKPDIRERSDQTVTRIDYSAVKSDDIL